MKGRSRIRTRGRIGSISLLSRATASLGVAPLHYWNFMSDRAIFAGKDVGGVTSTPGWSFTRASTGFANQVPNTEFGSQNIMLQSQTLTDAAWTNSVGGTGSAATRTANYAAAPDGTTTATRVQFALNGGATASDVSRISGATAGSLNGVGYVISFWAKLNTGSSASISIQGIGTTLASTPIAITNVWTRYSITCTTASTTPSVLIGLRGTFSTGDTMDVLLWGFQFELGSTATTYKPTTSSAVTDVSGPPLVSFGSGVLRRTNKGALIEGAATNLCLQSQTFGTTWTLGSATQTADQYVAPDATTTGDQLTAGAGLSTHFTTQAFTWTAAIHTVSVYAKYVNNRWFAITTFDGTTSRNASFDLQNGVVGALTNATSTITSVGGGWYRCTMTGSTAMAAAAGNIAFNVNATNVATNESYTALGTEIIGLWGAQIEASAFPTSYIPTTTASATRAADVATAPDARSAPFSMFVEFAPAFTTSGLDLIAYDTLTNGSGIYVPGASPPFGWVREAGVTTANVSGGGSAPVIDVAMKAAVRFAVNDTRAANSGLLGAADTVVSPPSTTTLKFAPSVFGGTQSVYLRSAAIFNSALNDAALVRAST